jgi:hypothetical protein
MVNKEQWGNAVWLLFHTLAEKLDDNYIRGNCKDILALIQIICKNLPCPECAQHAIETLKGGNLQHIKNKDDLKRFLWTFHNIVNQRIQKPILTIEYLDLYKRAVPYNVIQNFKNNFYNRPYNDKLLIDSFQMQGVKKQIDSQLDYFITSGVLH